MQRIWTDVTCFFSMHSGVAEQITLAGMALKALSFLKDMHSGVADHFKGHAFRSCRSDHTCRDGFEGSELFKALDYENIK